ncbi:MAG: hypothetical protein AABY15_01665 [Nanoarchaeota archaeon]
MKNLNLLIISLLFLTSCTDEGVSTVEKTLVVEQIEVNAETSCENCLEKEYRYRVKINSNSGEVYYYTNYRHEVGDTLVSSFEFADASKDELKEKTYEVDSLREANRIIQKRVDQLSLHNELLIGIIQENTLKNK